MAQTNSILAGLQTIFKPKTVKPATPITPAVAPTTPSYLTSALTPSGQTDLSSIQTRASQSIANQQVVSPDQITTAAKNLASSMKKMPKGTGDQSGKPSSQGIEASALLSDFENQLKAVQQTQSNQSMATQTIAEGAQKYIGAIRESTVQAKQDLSDAVAAWTKSSQSNDKYLADAYADMAKVTQTVLDLTEQYSKVPQTALVGSIVSGVTGLLQAGKSAFRAISEKYGADSKEAQEFTSNKQVAIGAMVGDLTSKAWDRTMSIRNTGLGAYATAATALSTNVNWIRQAAMTHAENANNAIASYKFNTTAVVATNAALENTEYKFVADWYDKSYVMVPEIAPLMQQLLDIKKEYDLNVVAMKDANATKLAWDPWGTPAGLTSTKSAYNTGPSTSLAQMNKTV
jgi:hypothetical protein